MGRSAQVRSVQALERLQGELKRFGSDASDALRAVEQELRRAEAWLDERERHWRGEVERRREAVRQAEVALARCRASGGTDREGRYHAPNCSAYERSLFEAQRALQAAEKELRTVQEWAREVARAAAAYRPQAERLKQQVQAEVPRATARLERKVGQLHRYLRLAPRQASRLGPPAPLRVAGQQRPSVPHAGAAAWPGQLEQAGWQERLGGRPVHGFGRVYSAAGQPLVALDEEDETDEGLAGAGRADVSRTAIPASSISERVAALAQDLGTGDTSAVVVAQPETGLADLFYRGAGGGWQRLRAGVSLEEALRAAALLNEEPPRARGRRRITRWG